MSEHLDIRECAVCRVNHERELRELTEKHVREALELKQSISENKREARVAWIMVALSVIALLASLIKLTK